MKHAKLTKTVFWLLMLQFVLGMLANLYGTIPHDKPYDVFRQVGFISAHALNGSLLLILGIVLAVKSRHTDAFRPAAAGVFHVALAFTFGELFVFTQQDIFSLLMALAFVGALVIYAKLVFADSDSK
ncbi:MAG TPA: hypothetical protein VHD60_02170 [Candidatus Saccharimonadales bacterium]|nr:hypothetical protein [Candidatus Saccharimonadales bacterium]